MLTLCSDTVIPAAGLGSWATCFNIRLLTAFPNHEHILPTYMEVQDIDKLQRAFSEPAGGALEFNRPSQDLVDSVVHDWED